MRTTVSSLFLCAFAGISLAQTTPIDIYLNTPDSASVANNTSRTDLDIRSVLPARQSQRYAQYVAAKTKYVDEAALKAAIEKLRLNKIVGNTAGGSGTTSLVSSVAVPAVLGFVNESGAILQKTNGNTTTLRGNLLGISRLVLGQTQFPDCANTCAAQWLRRFSAGISFENVSTKTVTGTAATATSTVPVTADLFGNNYRMASWSARFDFTHNDPFDPAYTMVWKTAIDKLKKDKAGADLTQAVSDLFTDTATGNVTDIYTDWQAQTVQALRGLDAAHFKQMLDDRLLALTDRLAAADPAFGTRVATLRRGFENYASVRDDILKAIQSHKLSLEYTNLHPRGQAYTSNLRFIYSHQPTNQPTLITVNAAFTWYNSLPPGVKSGTLRDVQIAGQIDRRLGEIPNLGNATLTLGGYYQYMKNDAVIVIGPGNVAPGSGIVLPGTAATLLGTKGNIGIVQGKLSIPISGAVKIPLSVTWSNRAELIKEADIRGQVGITFDMDSIFTKH